MCIKKFRILIFVLLLVYMIGKIVVDFFCIKIFFFIDRFFVDIEIYLEDI